LTSSAPWSMRYGDSRHKFRQRKYTHCNLLISLI
jgi:hypothetical protein